MTLRTRRNSRSLAGRWRFATDPEGKGDFGEPDGSIESWQRQVTFFDTEYDDSGWDEIAVPACWRHKFRPCNGALFFQFKDCWPALTAAVVDYYGRPKRAYYTLRHACNPIHVLMEWPPLAGEAPGSAFRKDLYVVNDYHHPYPALQVRWQIRDASGTPLLEQEIACSIAANSLTKVADVAWTIPPTPGACYRITVALSAP